MNAKRVSTNFLNVICTSLLAQSQNSGRVWTVATVCHRALPYRRRRLHNTQVIKLKQEWPTYLFQETTFLSKIADFCAKAHRLCDQRFFVEHCRLRVYCELSQDLDHHWPSLSSQPFPNCAERTKLMNSTGSSWGRPPETSDTLHLCPPGCRVHLTC